MSDEKSTFGKITLRYNPVLEELDENDQPLRGDEVTIESPINLLDDSRKLIHILNQKSDSGRELYQSCVDYINEMVSSRKIPLDAKMVVENDDHKMTCKLEDYFAFITSSGNIALESFGSKTSEIGLTWLAVPEAEAETEDQSAE